jgi:DNA-binding transcriptional LysR family regulator
LNLLRALDVLLRTRSVTIAGQRLGITQAAASNALRRLRLHFGDPLLVRAGTKLVATPLAVALESQATEAMAAVSRVLRPEEFVAARARAQVRIATSDHVDAVVLEPLAKLLVSDAPGLSLFVEGISRDASARATRGEVDWVLAPRTHVSAPLHVTRLLEEPYVVVMRRDHPAGRERLTAAAFAGLTHVIVAPAGGEAQTVVDVALAGRGLVRAIARVVPVFSQALLLVAESSLVTTMPRSMAARYADRLGLRLARPPFSLPSVRIDLAWPDRIHSDPLHKWLRQRVLEVARRELAALA